MVKGFLEKAKEEFPEVSFHEVDLTEHPEVAVKYGVMATPALVINGRLEFIGVPQEKQLKARLEALLASG